MTGVIVMCGAMYGAGVSSPLSGARLSGLTGPGLGLHVWSNEQNYDLLSRTPPGGGLCTEYRQEFRKYVDELSLLSP